MMRLVLIAMACALATGCETPAPAPPTPFYTLTDLTDEYAAFYDRTEGMAPAERVAAFKTELNGALPGFYDAARMRGVTPERYDALIATSFDNFPTIRERYTATAANFAGMMEPARASFAAAFPDVAPIGQVYLLHSLSEMDGGTRTINGQSYLIFGADVMARIYPPGEERPFFHHELFHVYHRQHFTGGCEAVWCGLWREGLATYVAHTLNPEASDLQLLLTMPRPIRPEVDADPARAICAVRARLNSETPDDSAGLFRGNANLEGLPPRVGYYVGYLAAREAGRTRTPRQLAHLTVAEAQPVVEAALASLAECPPPN